jgi:spermidine synthase
MRNAVVALIVFFGGFIVMVLEIIGVRFLAKDFGTYFSVWVSQIGVVLIALMLGYYLGGAMADRWQRPGVLAFLLVPAGLMLLLIPDYAGWLIDKIISRHAVNEPIPPIWQKLDPVLGSASVFLVPCVALAALPPFMIRMVTHSLSQVGRSSGAIIAASTLGSIAGAFISGFILFEMRVSNIFRAMGGLTLLLGAICPILDRWLTSACRNRDRGNEVELTTNTKLPGFIMMALLIFVVSRSSSAAVVFETSSPYHHIRVVDEGQFRTLCFDDALESRMSLQEPVKGHFEYTEYFQMPWLWNTQIVSVLMIGLGGGTTQRAFEHYYPQVHVETVEIDPVVLQVAREYFQFREDERQKVWVEDGRVFLRRNPAKRDLILLDAYVQGRYGSAIPQHLATREFFELVRERLTTNGIVAYNVIGSMQGWHADIVGAIFRTLKAVFPQVYAFPARSSQNVVLVATRAAVRADPNALRQRMALMIQTGRLTMPTFRERFEEFRAQPPLTAMTSPLLTDDYAPVEGLAAVGGGTPEGRGRQQR